MNDKQKSNEEDLIATKKAFSHSSIYDIDVLNALILIVQKDDKMAIERKIGILTGLFAQKRQLQWNVLTFLGNDDVKK